MFFKVWPEQVWWHIPAVLTYGKTRQEDHEFKASLAYKEKKKSHPEDYKEVFWQGWGQLRGINNQAYTREKREQEAREIGPR